MKRLLRTVLALMVVGCGDEGSAVNVDPLPPPQRTAAQDRALRAMAMDVVEAQACDLVRGAFLPVPEERVAASRAEQPSVVGRLWVSECNVERRGDGLSMRVGGQGWQWIDRASAGPLGATFRVRGPVRFQASVELEAEVDLRYDTATHRFLVALTPTRTVRARVSPIGELPVEGDGGWSNIVGGLAGMLGTPLGEQARPIVEQEGALLLQRQLRSGATFVLDLCTGQLDGALGALGDGEATPARPYASEERWLDNARVILRPATFDLAGPFASDEERVHVDVEVEHGGAVTASLVCRDAAERTAADYLSQGVVAPSAASVQRRVTSSTTLTLQPGTCREAFLRVEPTEAETRYRYRVRREGETARPLVRCAR